MLFTLFVAVLAALVWALRSALMDAGGASTPHDPSTFELAAMGMLTLAVYAWMKRLRAIRDRSAQNSAELLAAEPQLPVGTRYAEAKAEAEAEQEISTEKVLSGSEHAA